MTPITNNHDGEPSGPKPSGSTRCPVTVVQTPSSFIFANLANDGHLLNLTPLVDFTEA